MRIKNNSLKKINPGVWSFIYFTEIILLYFAFGFQNIKSSPHWSLFLNQWTCTEARLGLLCGTCHLQPPEPCPQCPCQGTKCHRAPALSTAMSQGSSTEPPLLPQRFPLCPLPQPWAVMCRVSLGRGSGTHCGCRCCQGTEREAPAAAPVPCDDPKLLLQP